MAGEEKKISWWKAPLLSALVAIVFSLGTFLVATGEQRERVNTNRVLLEKLTDLQAQTTEFLGAQKEINKNLQDHIDKLEGRVDRHIERHPGATAPRRGNVSTSDPTD